MLKITALGTASIVCVALLGCDSSSSSGGGGQPTQVRKVEPGSTVEAPGKAGAAPTATPSDGGAGKK